MKRNTFNLLILTIPLLFYCAKSKQQKTIEEGLHPYKMKDRYGFIGYINGERVYIEPRFEYASNFKEGLAVIKYEGKYGYINEKGKIVIQPVFDFAYDFNEGYARVRKGYKYGFINKEGRLVIDFLYDEAKDFKNNKALVRVGTNEYYIFPDGSIVKESNTNSPFRYRPKNF